MMGFVQWRVPLSEQGGVNVRKIEIICPEEAALLMERLEAAGYETYVVGGCVRDAILGASPHDWDLTTSATPDEIKAALPDFRCLDTGIKHGTVTIAGEKLYEITTFRVDGRYSDSRHPDQVIFSRMLRDDLSRRDFTINAMAYSPKRGLVDLFGGMDDLRHGVIRCVGDAGRRMEEDALRVMRAVRFQSKLGFEIEHGTREAVERHIPGLSKVSKERVGSEFLQILSAPHAARAIRENQTLFCALVPALRESLGFAQTDPYHNLDVFEHTLAALEAAEQKRGKFPAEWADAQVRLALFFHDLGKPACRTRDEGGAFDGHAQKSAEIARASMRTLRFCNEMVNDVCELVMLHDAELGLDRPAVKRWLARLPEIQLKRLLKVKECDLAAQTELAAPRLERTVEFWMLARRLLSEHAAFRVKDLAVSGKDLTRQGIPPGKGMGIILKRLLDEVIEENIPNEAPALLARARQMRDELE